MLRTFLILALLLILASTAEARQSRFGFRYRIFGQNTTHRVHATTVMHSSPGPRVAAPSGCPNGVCPLPAAKK